MVAIMLQVMTANQTPRLAGKGCAAAVLLR